MPAFLTLFLQGLAAAISAAPQVEKVIMAGKDFIVGLFSSGLIDKATQYRVHAYIDDMADAIKRGETPPELTVEPDPEAGAAS